MTEYPTSSRPEVPLTTRIRRTGDQLSVTGTVGSLQLSAVAGDLFAAIDGHRSLAAVAAAVAQIYDVPAEQVLADLHPLVTDLLEAGAIRCEN